MNQAIQIANFFIQKSHQTGVELTPMKLIKLVYISHGWHLGLFGAPLIDEAVCAWKYGPVIETLYAEFKNYGNGQIKEMYRDPFSAQYPSVKPDSIPILERIWEVYSPFSGIELSTMTHEVGTPWDTTWNLNGGKNKSSAIIPNDLIQSYYKVKAANSGNDKTA